MSLYVHFWGTRGSIPTPGPQTHKYGGNTACVEVRGERALFICDGGTGLRELGLDLARRGGGAVKGHMLFSHPHWDHIQGFPFFTPIYDPKNTFVVYGPRKGDRRIFELLSGQMQSDYFPVSFSELEARLVCDDLGEGERELDGVTVAAQLQPHPGGSHAFSFRENGAKVVYATDCELDRVIEEPAQVEAAPRSLRRLPGDLVEFARGADLLVADAQYTDGEYPARRGWGHARATTAVDLAVAAGAKKLALFHHDPLHTDADVDRIVEECQARAQAHGSELAVFGAREGVGLRAGARPGGQAL